MSNYPWRRGKLSGCDRQVLQALESWQSAHRCPSLRRLCQLTGRSYASVRDSMRLLADQGLAVYEPKEYMTSRATKAGSKYLQEHP